jgi:serine protease Do
VLRGGQTLDFQVPAVAADDRFYNLTSIDPRDSLISELGIFGKTLSAALALGIGLRSETGVYVVATTLGGDGDAAGLASGDVITSINGIAILDIQALRKTVRELIGLKPIVLEVERHGSYLYIDRDLEDGPPVSGADRDATSDSKTAPARGRH